MVYLRSEVHLARWLEANGWEPGATLTATKMWELAQRWWSTRLEADWRPRLTGASQTILDDLGFAGDFWQLA